MNWFKLSKVNIAGISSLNIPAYSGSVIFCVNNLVPPLKNVRANLCKKLRAAVT
jgi:hypothetical protein